MTEAEADVKKWREDGTLTGRIFNFSKEDKDKYFLFIELDEFYDAALQLWVQKRLVLLKEKKELEENVHAELGKLTSKQRTDSLEFLRNELKKSDKKNYESEIRFMIECLEKFENGGK